MCCFSRVSVWVCEFFCNGIFSLYSLGLLLPVLWIGLCGLHFLFCFVVRSSCVLWPFRLPLFVLLLCDCLPHPDWFHLVLVNLPFFLSPSLHVPSVPHSYLFLVLLVFLDTVVLVQLYLDLSACFGLTPWF